MTPRFDWDTSNLDHIAAHGVTPEEAESAVNDPRVLFAGIDTGEGEWRIELVGRAHSGRIIVVVVTPGGERTRVVTAYAARSRRLREYLERS